MTETSSPSPNGKRLYSIKPCPPDGPCIDGQSTVKPVAEPTKYENTELTHGEAARLVEARTAAESHVSGQLTHIAEAAGAVQDQAGKSKLAVHELRIFAKSGEVRDRNAIRHKVWDRHRKDGPPDCRHQPRWLRWLHWPVAIGAGAYDTAFLAVQFLDLIDVKASWTSLTTYVAMLPGVLITGLLLAIGYLVGREWVRSRVHAENATERTIHRLTWKTWRPGIETFPRQREPQEIPFPRWLLPAVLTLFLLTTMGMWAFLRSVEEPDEKLLYTPAVITLLLMLSIAAIVLKALSHNPYADDEKLAETRLAATMDTCTRLTEEAVRSVNEFDAANHALDVLLMNTERDALRYRDEAWVRILNDRDRHQLASTVAPLFQPAGEPGPDGARRLFADILEPDISLAPLMEARKSLRAKDVHTDRTELEELLVTLAKQAQPDQPNPGN